MLDRAVLRLAERPALQAPTAVYHAPGTATAAAMVAALDRDGACHVADLSVGGWRPHHLAAEWAALPDTRAADADRGTNQAPPSIDFAEVAAAGIEAEALGTRVVREAHARATALLARDRDGRRRSFVAIVPHAPHGWREDDMLLLRYVADALDPTRDRLILLATAAPRDANILPPEIAIEWHDADPDDSPLDPGGDSALGGLPGLLPAEFAAAGVPLSDGRILVSPSRRATRLAPTDFDRLKPMLADTTWLSAYAELRGSNFHIDPRAMAAHAARAFAAGAAELSIDYLKRGIDCARGAWRNGLLCQLQGYRIAAHRFDEAAGQDIGRDAMGQVGAFLEMSRGWGYALRGDGVTALPHLTRAAELLSAAPDRSFERYLRNITALALARCRRADEALALENLIAAENVPPDRSWAMHFVNQINLARLHAARDTARAAVHYAEAFATQDGARSPVDQIYGNAIRARLAERTDADARPHWLRAALHFAAWPVPEALGSRHAAAFVPHGAADLSPHARTEAVAAALSARLGYADIECDDDRPGAVAITPGDPLDARQHASAVLLGDGWSAVAMDRPIVPTIGGPARRRLGRCLAEELVRSAPAADRPRIAAVAIDDGLGSDVALDRRACAETALRLGVSLLFDRGRRLSIDHEEALRLLRSARLALNPQVIRVRRDGDRVTLGFKRYHAEAVVDDPLRLVERAQHGADVAHLIDGADEATLIAELRRLERVRAVRLTVPDDAGAAWIATA